VQKLISETIFDLFSYLNKTVFSFRNMYGVCEEKQTIWL